MTDDARKRAQQERNARQFAAAQRNQPNPRGIGNQQRGGRSCLVVLLLMGSAVAGLADAIRSVIT